MNNLELYILLFTDTFVSNLAINNSTELALYSIKIFNSFYNSYVVLFTAILSVIAAFSANYLLGIAFYKILSPMNSDESHEKGSRRIELVKENKMLPIILLLSVIPFFGKFIILFAGFCRVPFTKTMLIGICAKFVYYIIVYFIL